MDPVPSGPSEQEQLLHAFRNYNGRFEPLGTLGVSFFLIAASVGIGQHSFELLYQMLPGLSDSLGQTLPRAFPPEVVESLKTHIMQIMVYIGNHIPEHHHEAAIPIHSSALWFAAVSVVAKELLYQSTMSVARKLNSQVLVANAWHHRSDAYSSIIAAAAILGAQLGVPILDPLGGMVVAAILIKNGCSIGWEAMQELVDRSALSSTQITKQVEQLLGATPDQHQPSDYTSPTDYSIKHGASASSPLTNTQWAPYARVVDVKTRKYGPDFRVQVTLQIRPVSAVVSHTEETLPPPPGVIDLLDLQEAIKRDIFQKVEHVQEVTIVWSASPQG
ncbi:hypothetical protein H4R33_002037 [Dimargaris cristalligena]|nr:hypothetical protein H4R33_002037 [Dimargaris cristalligena]